MGDLTSDETATYDAPDLRVVVDVAAMAKSLLIVAETVDNVTKAMGGVAHIAQNLSRAVEVLAQASSQYAEIGRRSAETLSKAVREFLEDQGRVRLRPRYLPGARLIDLRREHTALIWTALLAQLRRSSNWPSPRIHMIALAVQPNGPNRSTALIYPAIELREAA